MPTIQRDRGVVGVANAAFHEDRWISTHDGPTPCFRFGVTAQNRRVLPRENAFRMARANIDRFATHPIAEFGPVRLSADPAPQRFVFQDQLLRYHHVRVGDEKPLALANERGVLATFAGLAPQARASLCREHPDGLEGFLGLTNVADRGRFGNSSDKPMALVVPAKEFALVVTVANEEQQVAICRPRVEDGELRLGAWAAKKPVELALAIGLDIERVRDANTGLSKSGLGDFQPRADAGKLGFEKIRVHGQEDTVPPCGVRFR